jgi:hypothetical protein
MRMAIGSDHAGFALKEAVKVFLTAEHRDIRLCGSRRSSLARQTGRARHSALRERRWRLDGRSARVDTSGA